MNLKEFVRENNAIERIFREPTQEEIDELERFIFLKKITVEELERFVKIYQPDARLRDEYGLNVRVGSYYPPFGHPHMRKDLQDLIDKGYDHYFLHMYYEKLHPFTDGNGRSGRALWAWSYNLKERDIDSFLTIFYFETLQRFAGQRIGGGE